MTEATSLPDLLRHVEQIWRAQSAPVALHLAPGATREQLDLFESTTGLPLSTELRQWWSWHNGVLPQERYDLAARCIGPGGWELMSLDEARVDRDEWATTKSSYGLPWDTSWLPIARCAQNARVIARTHDNDGDRTPIGIVELPYEGEFGAPVTDSLTAIVTIWTSMLDDRYYWFDTSTGTWEDRFAETPLDLRLRGII